MVRTLCWIATVVCLSGCTPPWGDLHLVAVGANDIELAGGSADIERFVLRSCDDGALHEVPVGATIDLLDPAPFAAEAGTWCAVGVELAEDPFDGSLALEGTTASGTPYLLALDPGLALLDQAVEIQEEGDNLLVLDLDLLVASDELDALAPEAVVEPDDALGEDLADAVSDALWFGTREEARAVFTIDVDLWPFDDIHFEAEAEWSGGGCGGGASAPAPDTGVGSGDTDDTDDTAPTGSTQGCGDGGQDRTGCDGGGCGGGCDGGGGTGCDGGGCAGSCDAGCSVTGLVPVWLMAVGIALRRRQRPGWARPWAASASGSGAASRS